MDHLSERWNRFSWFGTQWVKADSTLSADKATLSNSVEAALNVLEAVSIAVSEPRLNLQRGKWGDATKYFQYVEKEVEDGEE